MRLFLEVDMLNEIPKKSNGNPKGDRLPVFPENSVSSILPVSWWTALL